MLDVYSDSTSLKDYLKKYRINDDMDKKRKKKRKPKLDSADAGVTLVDEDPIWHKPLISVEDIDVDHLNFDRKIRHRNDTPSPEPRRRSKFPATSDVSPPPRSVKPVRNSIRNLNDHDISPPRKKSKESTIFSRPKSGLVSLEEFRDEILKKRKEDWLRFTEMDPSVSGRGAEPIYRSKLTGQRISKEESLMSLKKVAKKKEKPKEKKLEWGKGLAQKREAEARIQEMEAQKNKPFARSRDDPDLNAMLKERVRWGDPVVHLVEKKRLESGLRDLGDSKEMKESGFVIPQDILTHSWIRRGLTAAPNRYGIEPGRHWDGVDRSNGYENQSFKEMDEKKATEIEAYLWSVSEM